MLWTTVWQFKWNTLFYINTRNRKIHITLNRKEVNASKRRNIHTQTLFVVFVYIYMWQIKIRNWKDTC